MSIGDLLDLNVSDVDGRGPREGEPRGPATVDQARQEEGRGGVPNLLRVRRMRRPEEVPGRKGEKTRRGRKG